MSHSSLENLCDKPSSQRKLLFRVSVTFQKKNLMHRAIVTFINTVLSEYNGKKKTRWNRIQNFIMEVRRYFMFGEKSGISV